MKTDYVVFFNGDYPLLLLLQLLLFARLAGLAGLATHSPSF